jgi:hypothetical protein
MDNVDDVPSIVSSNAGVGIIDGGSTAGPTAQPTDPPGTPEPTSPPVLPGDVNNDGSIDIIDALLTAQYYVGLNPDPFNTDAADVTCDGSVDIVDALRMAQYYVGLVGPFSPCT